MGLKKETPEVKDGAGTPPAAASAQTPPPEAPPETPPEAPPETPPEAPPETPPAAAKKVKDAPEGGAQVMLRAATQSIGDPLTSIKYETALPRPGFRREGNWVDCQVKAGVLIETPMPKEQEKGEDK